MSILIPDYGDAVLLFSGGVESTLLLYLCMARGDDLIVVVLDRFNRPLSHAKNIVSDISERLNRPIALETFVPPEVVLPQHQVNLAIAAMHIKYRRPIITGVNKYAPGITPTWPVNFIESAILKMPLAAYTKDQIIQEFFDLGIDDLLPMTHSCGLSGQQPCGTCYNCTERAWAYNAINKPIHLGA